MISIKVKNPDIILAPITDEEKEQMESKFMGDECLYVLYKLPESEDINIGMLASSVRKYSPGVANVWKLRNATTMAFFVNGASELEEAAPRITSRPVYRINPSDDRKVSSYKLLNGNAENGLDVSLEDVVDGKYTVTRKASAPKEKVKHI